MQDALNTGKSIYFMVASNPGAGLGLLLAYAVFGQGASKSTAPGAIIIHFFGGIHEMYFPYVLMKPITIISMICGSACGIFTFQLFGVGLAAGPSPGSIFAYLALTPKGNFLGVIAGVLVAAIVSFVITSFILKVSKVNNDEELNASMIQSKAMKQEGKDLFNSVTTGKNSSNNKISFIAYACDAGMGSSAMGASLLKKKLAKMGIDIKVEHFAIEKVPENVDLIVTHKNLYDRAKMVSGNKEIITIENYLKDTNIDMLIERIKQENNK